MSGYTVTGTLGEINLAGIFLTIYLHQFSGSLVITHESVEKKIYFVKGTAAFAASNLKSDRLGDKLLQTGKITQKEYEDSVKILQETGKRHGTILMQLKYISLPELIKAVRFQLKDIIFSLFKWETGHFKFKGGSLPLNEVVTLKEDTANLVLEGIKKVNRENDIKTGISKIDSIIHVSREKDRTSMQIRLTPYELKLIEYCEDNPRTIQELCDWSEYDIIETCKFLFLLLTHNFIRIESKSIIFPEPSISMT